LSRGLFEDPPEGRAAPRRRSEGRPRLREPRRDEIALRAVDLDSVIGADHPARLFWAYVSRLDLRVLDDRIKSREGRAGHPAAAPRLLMALWLYATSEGVGSARALDELCRSHDAYRWLCGGVSVNYHTLADFRVAQGALLDELLTQNVAALAAAGLIDLSILAHDGMRVRAAAGAASFRRKKTIVEHLDEARQLVETLKREATEAPDASRNRVRAAKERAARECENRLAAALAKHDEIAARQPPEPKPKTDETPNNKTPSDSEPPDSDAPDLEATDAAPKKKLKEPRVSTTDPQARVIKMPDGGFRPAYNMQITSAAGTLIVIGVDVASNSSDRGLLKPAIEQIHARYGALPKECLADGGFTKNQDIEWAAAQGVAVFCPPIKNKHATDPYAPRSDDGPGLAAWRKRMAADAGQQHYKRRSITECIHAHMRDSGLYRLTVRGLDKVKTILQWQALAHNILHGHRLALAKTQ
jgi:transposase